MKKLISILITLSMLLSAVPMISQAKAVSEPIFIDFESYTSGTSYHNNYVALSYKDNATDETEGGSGKAIKLTSPREAKAADAGGEKDNYLNFQTTLTSDAVIGFSAMAVDKEAAFSVASKGLGNVWGDSAVSGFFEFKGTSIKFDGKEVFQNEPGAWNNIVLVMNYSSHKIDMYLNGEYKATKTLKDAVIGTEYFNFNIYRNKFADVENAKEDKIMAAVYLDNLFTYYKSDKVTADVSGEMVDSKNVTEINIDFGQNVLIDEYSSAVMLNGEYVEAEPVEQNGYVNGLILKTLSLSGKTEYEITFPGVKDFFGDVLTATHSFTTASTDPVVSISCDGADKIYPSDTKITFGISNANLEGNPIVIYNNDEIVDTLTPDAKEFTVVLVGGENNIYAEVPAFDIKSETISITAEAYEIIGTEKIIDFENGTTAGISNVGKAAGSITVKDSDEEHGKSLFFEVDGAQVDVSKAENRPFVIVEQLTGKKGIYVYEADFKFSQVESGGNFFSLKCLKDGKEIWNSLYTMSNSEIKLQSGTKEVIYSGLEANKWYRMKAVWNSDTSTSDFYVDDVLVASEVPFSTKNIDSYIYVNISMNPKKGAYSTMYMDNIRTYFTGKKANAEAQFDGCDSEEVPYENAGVSLAFDQLMNPDTLKGVKLTDENGNETAVDFETSDNRVFTATIASLKHNTGYTLDLSLCRTDAGAGVNQAEVRFKTRKLPFAIKDASVFELGSKVNIDVDIQNMNSEEKTYIVIAGLYSGTKMLCSDAKAYVSSKSEKAEFSINKPDGDYKVEIYVFDSAQSLNLIDKLIVE